MKVYSGKVSEKADLQAEDRVAQFKCEEGHVHDCGAFLFAQVIDTARGQALADEFGIKFFETSAKNNINVEKAFFEIARDVMKRLQESEGKDGPAKTGTVIIKKEGSAGGASKCSC